MIYCKTSGMRSRPHTFFSPGPRLSYIRPCVCLYILKKLFVLQIMHVAYLVEQFVDSELGGF